MEGTPGELRFVIEITRKDTGAVETYQVIGNIVADDEEEDEQ